MRSSRGACHSWRTMLTWCTSGLSPPSDAASGGQTRSPHGHGTTNAHTRYAYEVVRAESQRLGVALPADQEHAYNVERLRIEEQEYEMADYLLCPSEFDGSDVPGPGICAREALRHFYGFDDPGSLRGLTHTTKDTVPSRCCSSGSPRFARVSTSPSRRGWPLPPPARAGHSRLRRDSAGLRCVPCAHARGSERSRVLGHGHDVPELMRSSDVLVLPSIEEGSALVCNEAIASGCVPLVSARPGAAPAAHGERSRARRR